MTVDTTRQVILTCQRHMAEMCNGGHGQSRQNCPFCFPRAAQAGTEECVYCQKVLPYRVPPAPLLDFARALKTTFVGLACQVEEPYTNSRLGQVRSIGRVYACEEMKEPECLPRPIYRLSGADYQWGCVGPGPGALAQALLSYLTGDEIYAHARRYAFMCEVIVNLPHGCDWRMRASKIMEWVKRHSLSPMERFCWLPANEQFRILDMDVIEKSPSPCCGAQQEWVAVCRARCLRCRKEYEF